MQLTPDNRARRDGPGYSISQTTATPSSQDYSVEADLFYEGNLANDVAGVIGRFNTSMPDAA